MHSLIRLVIPLGFLLSTGPPVGYGAAPSVEVVPTSRVAWSPLNPARGDKGPAAGALWGDRTGSGPSGFLVRFGRGFASPPHVHNVAYRALVIRGLIHNDDPHAAEMWMPEGSFWTQPAGEEHITAAADGDNVAYVEIEDGPYLVLPSEESFDSGERPVNVDESNIVWLGMPEACPGGRDESRGREDGPRIAFLWGDPADDEPGGLLVKLPAGFEGALRGEGTTLRAVVLAGRVEHRAGREVDAVSLDPGGYFSSRGRALHQVGCGAEGCTIYVRTERGLDFDSGWVAGVKEAKE